MGGIEYEGNRSAWLKSVARSQFLRAAPGVSKLLASVHGPTDFLNVRFSFLVPPNGVGMTGSAGQDGDTEAVCTYVQVCYPSGIFQSRDQSAEPGFVSRVHCCHF